MAMTKLAAGVKMSGEVATPERLRATLDRLMADARRLMGDPFNQVYGLAFRAEYVAPLFHKATRAFDLVCAALNAWDGQRRPAAEAFLDLPNGAEGDALQRCGLRRGGRGAWETDYLALEYALNRDPDEVLGLVEAIARTLAGPDVLCAA